MKRKFRSSLLAVLFALSTIIIPISQAKASMPDVIELFKATDQVQSASSYLTQVKSAADGIMTSIDGFIDALHFDTIMNNFKTTLLTNASGYAAGQIGNVTTALNNAGVPAKVTTSVNNSLANATTNMNGLNSTASGNLTTTTDNTALNNKSNAFDLTSFINNYVGHVPSSVISALGSLSYNGTDINSFISDYNSFISDNSSFFR